MHTKSVDGQKGTPDDRAAKVLNFYTNQRESSFQMPMTEQFAKHSISSVKDYRLDAKLTLFFCFNWLYVFISDTILSTFFLISILLFLCTYVMNFTFSLLTH